jgi:hypothetical protein
MVRALELTAPQSGQTGCNRCAFTGKAQTYAPLLSLELGTRYFWICVTIRYPQNPFSRTNGHSKCIT